MLGAHYQCYQNPVNFLRSVKSFRMYYPESTLIIHSDGGDDYSRICKQYNGTYTHHPRMDPPVSNLVYSSPDPILRYLTRLWSTFDTLSEPYVILLEDDVRILQHHSAPFLFDINGCNRKELLPSEMRQRLPNQEHFYGACGGCVLNRNFFRTIPFARVEQVIRSIRMPSYASDQCITFIARLFGGTIGDYPEFAEEWYPNIQELRESGKVSFLHNYKEEYGDEFTLLEKNEIDSLNVD